MLYRLETSSPDLARVILLELWESPLYHSVFGTASPQGSVLPYTSGQRLSDMLWTVFYIDMQISGLTKQPRLLDHEGSGITTVDAINTAAANVASLKRSSESFLLSVALAMTIELRKMTATDGQSSATSSSKLTNLARLEDWRELEGRLNSWENIFQTVFSDNECNPQLSL